MTTTPIAEAHQAETPVDAKLTAQDRCDVGNCGAAAHVRVAIGESALDFCGHHFRKNEPGLMGTSGARVVADTRDTLKTTLGTGI